MSRRQAEGEEAAHVDELGIGTEPLPEEVVSQFTYMERRPIAGGHFGVEPYETQVVTGASVPPGAVEVPADTPLHGWQPGRQWLPGAGPDGMP